MRIEPKDFQDDAVHRLAEEIEAARREIDRGTAAGGSAFLPDRIGQDRHHDAAHGTDVGGP